MAPEKLKSKSTGEVFEFEKLGQSDKKAHIKAVRVEPCERCTDFRKSGSNQYDDRWTCKVCGTNTIQKRVVEERTVIPTEECPHENVDNSRSSKTIHRWLCCDCQTLIGEEPQEVYKQRVKDSLDTSQPTVRKAAASGPVLPH